MPQKYKFIARFRSLAKNFLKRYAPFINDVPVGDGRQMSYKATAFLAKKDLEYNLNTPNKDISAKH
ncbi:MAG: hypothetical protein PHQ96_04235 [Candidatus Omnitrophica bacterium]|nr:hypothetical protein [Candidatus Omnitrophota bacterium]